MGGHSLHRRRGTQQLGAVGPAGMQRHNGGLSFGDGAGLVQHDGVNVVGDLQDLAGSDQDALPGAETRAHHDGGRRCQAQRAGAGDHQHGGKNLQHEGGGLSRQGPGHRRQGGNGDHHRHEHACYFIRQAGDGRLFALGVFHETDDARQGGILARTGHFDVQNAVLIHAAADGLAALAFFHGQALAGQHGFVDAALTLDHHAVGRNAGAGLDQHHVALLQALGGDFPAAVRQDGGVGRQLHQSGDGGFGLSHIAALHEFAERDQGQNHGCGLIVQVMHAGGIVGDQEGHHHAVHEGTGGTDGHQGIHVGIGVEQRLEAADEKVAAAVQDGNGQQQLRDGKVHAVGVHGEQIRQRQGRQAEGQHLSHGYVQ